MYNKIELIGRLTADPVKKDPINFNNQLITKANFNLACNEYKGKSKEQTVVFIPCQTIGKVAEALLQYQKKGNLLHVVGKWKTYNFKKNDEDRIFSYCEVKEIHFLTSKPKEEQQSSQSTNTNAGFDF